MVNNAGIGTGGSLHELDPEEIDRCLDINLKGVRLRARRRPTPICKRLRPGRPLINIASAAGIAGSADMSVYCATKFGVRAVSESLDAEWAPDRITVASNLPELHRNPAAGWHGQPQVERTDPRPGAGLPGWKSRRSRKSPGRCGTR